jgi:DNA polymerase-1
MDKLIVIDGNSIANRAFYALPLLSNSAGLHTNAVFGFTTMLLRLIEEEQPTHMLVAFDAGKVTFRHETYAEYKGTRAKTPPELAEQFPLIRELADSFGIARFELEGYEADDIIGTLTRLADERKDMNVLVVTGDKDMLQLASDQVTIAITRKGISETERFDPARIRETYGLEPAQIIDLKGLMGDTSDNIPGIPGIGEKTALKLLHAYGSVENVLANVHNLKGKMKENVETHREDALKSKQLATIFREVPIGADWSQFRFPGIDRDRLADMFRKLEFKSLLEKLGAPASAAGGTGGGDAASVAVETVIVTEATLDELTPDVLRATEALQVEIAGDNPHAAEVLGLALYGEGKARYVPLSLVQSPRAEALRAWLSDADSPKVLYDGHKAMVALGWQGIRLSGVRFDVMLAAYLLDPAGGEQPIAAIARKFGAPAVPAEEDVYGKGAKFRIPDAVEAANFAGMKAAVLKLLSDKMAEELDRLEMTELLTGLEQPLSVVLSRMELAGIRVDRDDLVRYGEELSGQIAELERQIHELAGGPFNINSTKQLGEVLFERLGLPAWKKTKTGYSTDAEVLERLEPYHPIVGYILHYRTLTKLQSTYIEGLQKEIRPETGKIHTYFRQGIAATGRLSSQYPNLQNIPIRLEEGKKIRKVFLPGEPGWLIMSADYSQIELRVLAHLSGDEKLQEAFIHDRDIHTETAMNVFGVAADEVDANMRRQAKAVNFGIVYGISDYGLSQNLHITRKEAAAFIEQYFSVFRGVRAFMDNIVQQARRDGFVTTILNRRRYLPEINASNFNQRSFAERTAMNTPIQGSAADIIKLAMVKLADRMKREGVRSRLLLQVHDELVFEVPEDELGNMRAMVKEEMENAAKLDVPLKVDVSWGANWFEAK